MKNVFQTKDMEFVNVSVPWMSDHFATVPQLVEKTLKTEQVVTSCLYTGRQRRLRNLCV